VCGVPAFSQIDLYAERIAILRGDTKGVISRLEGAIRSEEVRHDTLLYARTLETLGEEYYRISDIDEAHRVWEQAWNIRRDRWGMGTPEYGVALAYMARYHNYMSAPQLDHQGEAIRSASTTPSPVSTCRGA
jgi:hypothetical protein